MNLDGYLYFIGQEGSSSSLSSCFHGGSALENSTHWLNRFRSPLHVWQTDDNDMRERMCERNRLAAKDSWILHSDAVLAAACHPLCSCDGICFTATAEDSVLQGHARAVPRTRRIRFELDAHIERSRSSS